MKITLEDTPENIEYLKKKIFKMEFEDSEFKFLYNNLRAFPNTCFFEFYKELKKKYSNDDYFIELIDTDFGPQCIITNKKNNCAASFITSGYGREQGLLEMGVFKNNIKTEQMEILDTIGWLDTEHALQECENAFNGNTISKLNENEIWRNDNND